MIVPADCPTPAASHRLRGAEAAALMAFASMSCVQLALALSVRMFDQLDPLGVAGLRLVWAGRKRWTVMAAAGVVLLTQPWHGGIDPVGLAFTLAAGASATLVVLLVDGPSEWAE